MKILNFIKAHWRGLLFVTYLVACLVLTIGGLGWADYADKAFWYHGWNVLAGLGVVGFIGGIWWFSKQKNISW